LSSFFAARVSPSWRRVAYIHLRVIALYEQGIAIAPVLADLGKGQEFGDAATHGRAERAVLDLLTSGNPAATGNCPCWPSDRDGPVGIDSERSRADSPGPLSPARPPAAAVEELF
jgi:hypothetical protein